MYSPDVCGEEVLPEILSVTPRIANGKPNISVGWMSPDGTIGFAGTPWVGVFQVKESSREWQPRTGENQWPLNTFTPFKRHTDYDVRMYSKCQIADDYWIYSETFTETVTVNTDDAVPSWLFVKQHRSKPKRIIANWTIPKSADVSRVLVQVMDFDAGGEVVKELVLEGSKAKKKTKHTFRKMETGRTYYVLVWINDDYTPSSSDLLTLQR